MRFFVPGIPAPGGSKRAFIIHQKGCPAGRRGPAKGVCICKPFTTVQDDAGQRNKDWRATVVHEAALLMRDHGGLFDVALRLDVTFVMPRPKGHFGKAGNLLPSALKYHTVKPDRTKLLRALEDALTGVVWRDDALVVAGEILKVYGYPSGAKIQIEPMPTRRPWLLEVRANQPVLL